MAKNYSYFGVASVIGMSLLIGCAPPGYESEVFRSVSWPSGDAALEGDGRVQVEQLLNRLGYLSERPDGIITVATRTAIRTYQRDIGAPQTGFLSQPLLDSLRINAGLALETPMARPVAAPARSVPTDSRPSSSDDDSGGGAGGGGGGAWN